MTGSSKVLSEVKTKDFLQRTANRGNYVVVELEVTDVVTTCKIPVKQSINI